jgi:hypothetical protein
MLNGFLRRIETANDQNINKMHLYSFLCAFDSYDKENFMPYKVMNKVDVIFDDEKAIKKKTTHPFKLPRCSASPKNFRGLKVIEGGRAASITY